ncbi:hypothetical protein T02_673 [Trichinella nativa]|uniref:Uncharacterized protein n=1 Tax=Trichinella nativa TaxID=6335 RepID=A0A0V1KP97_9BILA|nr:hypothetical protein T02_673 [Trichinella nativa]
MIELNQFDVQRILMMMPNKRLGSLDVHAFGNTSRNTNGTAIYLRVESKDHRSFAPVKPHVGFRVCSTSSGGATASALLFCSEALHQKDHSMVPESFMLSFLSAGTSRP